MTGDQELRTRFTYHPPRGDQPQRYEALRGQAGLLALSIDQLAPDSREKDLALYHLESAVMWANAVIAWRET